MDVGGDVELCLGPVAESYPPQCSGIPLTNWSWDGVEGSESSGDVTWGAYALQGTYDGEEFAVTQPPIMLALYDPMPFPDPTNGEAGAGDETVAQARIGARHGLCVHAHVGVALAHPRMELAPRDEALQCLAQAPYGIVVQQRGVIQRALRVGEGLRGSGRLAARCVTGFGGSAHGREVCVGFFTHPPGLCGA